MYIVYVINHWYFVYMYNILHMMQIALRVSILHSQYFRMRPIHIWLYVFFNIYIQDFRKLFLGFYIYDTWT